LQSLNSKQTNKSDKIKTELTEKFNHFVSTYKPSLDKNLNIKSLQSSKF
jgi:hypothetical protein